VIVDAHAHAFPTVAWGHEWQRMLGVGEPRRSGQIDELAAIMDAASIDRTVLLLNARSGEYHEELLAAGVEEDDALERVRAQILELNRWGLEAAAADRRFLPFVGVSVRFQTEAQIVAEIDALAARGAKGVKIIPPSMLAYADDPRLWPVYERCAALGLPLLSQSGSGGGPRPDPDADHYGRPARWDAALREFPSLTVILAHLGHGYEEDIVELCARHDHVYTDTSLQLSRLGRDGHPTPEQLVALIRAIGSDRVLLGTNYPFVDPGAYVARLDELPLTDAEKAGVAGENFVRAVGA
jgi:predicted TIM-barrel fold metal-dependent hydrolase